MIVYRQKPEAFPAEIQGVQRVKEMKILGVIVSENLSFKTHLDAKLKETAQGLYALKVLKSHGLKNENLWDITKATLVSKLLYASPVWWGLLTLKLNIDYKLHCKNWSNLDSSPKNHPPFDLLCEKADASLFLSILANDDHVLHQLLPPIKDIPYALRPRMHDRETPKSYFENKMRRNFIPRMLTSGTY